MNGESEIGRK